MLTNHVLQLTEKYRGMIRAAANTSSDEDEDPESNPAMQIDGDA